MTLAILAIGGLAYALQQTMIVPALPTLQRELHTSATWTAWVVTGFLLVSAVATPLLGKLGDQYGKGRLLVISLSVFLVGCAGAAAAWDIWSLIAFRAVQGFGGAVFPLSFGIIRDEFPREKIGVAIGLVSSVFGVGGGLGIVLAGVFVDNLSWRWIFIVGASGLAVAVALVHRYVPESPVRAPSRVDARGAVLLSAGLASLLIALTEGESWGWSSPRTAGLFAASLAFFLAWGRVESRISEPMVDLRMLAHRPVLLTNVTALISGFAMFGSFVIFPAFAQSPRGLSPHVAGLVHYGFGASATKVGLYLLPGSLSMLIAGPAAGLAGRRYGSKWPLALGVLLVSLGAGFLAHWHDRPWQVVVAMFLISAGVSSAFAAMSAIVTEAVAPTETGIATGMNTVMRTIGGVFGAQVGAALLVARTIPGTHVPAESAFTTMFWISAVAGLFATAAALLVTPLRRRAPVATPAVETAE